MKMSSFFTCTKLPIFLCLILLASCGGGGGGDGQSPSQPAEQLSSFGQASDKTLAELNQIAAELSESTYTGVSIDAPVSTGSIQGVFAVLESLHGEELNVGTIFNKPGGQEVFQNGPQPQLLNLMLSRVVTAKVDQLALVSQKTTVDESEACDGGRGSLRIFGEIEDTGVGALNFTANDCLSEGVVFSGQGAIFSHDINFFEVTFYFDDFEMEAGSSIRYFSGRVLQRGSNEFIYNLTVSDEAREALFRLENFQDVGSTFKNFSGVIKLREFGAITVDVEQYRTESNGDIRFDQFSLSFDDTQVSASDVEGSSSDVRFYQFELVGGIDGTPAFGVLLHDELTGNSDVELTFSPLDEVNFPPSNFSVFIPNGNVADTTQDILAVVSLIDSDAMELRFRWFINDELVPNVEGERLPAGMAIGGDKVGVELVAEDERYSVTSEIFEIILLDAVPVITFAQAPVFNAGVQSSISVLHDDPDTKSIVEQDGLVLVSGPVGLSYNGTDIDWTPPNQFSRQLEYPVVFSKPDGTQETQYVVVKDETAASIDGVSMNSSALAPQIVGQFDSDPAFEVLNLLGDSISISEIQEDTIKQELFSSFPVFQDSNVTGITSGDINNDGVQEVFVASENHIVQVDLQERTTATVFSLLTDAFDNNDIEGVAFLASPPRLAINTTLDLLIVDATSGDILVTTPVVPIVNGRRVEASSFARSMHLGNVDDDASLEVILGRGLVVDANSGAIEWRMPEEISAIFEVADIDNDGRDEIVANTTDGRGSTSIQIFNAETQDSSGSLSELLGDSFFLVGATVFRVVNDNGRVVLMVGDIFTPDGTEGVVAFEVADQSATQIWSFPQPDLFANDLNILIDPTKENVHVIYGGSSAYSQYSIVPKDTGAPILTATLGCGDLLIHRVNELTEEIIFTCNRERIENGLFLATKTAESEPTIENILGLRVFDDPIVAQIDGDDALEVLASDFDNNAATVALDLELRDPFEIYPVELYDEFYELNVSIDPLEGDLITASAVFRDALVVDADAQEVLMVISSTGSGTDTNDLEATHDAALGVIAARARFNGLTLWEAQEGTIEARLIAEVERDCLSVEFHTINDDQRLLCTINVGFGSGVEESEVLMFDLSLNEIGSIAVENKALGVTSLPAKVDGADIVVAVQLPSPNVFRGAETFRLQGYEASTGSILWSTPALNGVVLGNGNDEDDFKVVSGLSPSGEVIIGVGSGPIMYDIR